MTAKVTKKNQDPKPKRQRNPSNFTVNFRTYADEICSREKAPHRWLSTKMGMNRGAFSELYHGINRDPRLSTCLKISAALGLPLAALAAKSPEERKAYRDAVWNQIPGHKKP